MLKNFYNLNTILQVITAGLTCLFATTLGSFLIFLINNNKKRLINIVDSISTGIMLGAAIFSLLIPAINTTSNIYTIILGLNIGVLSIFILNKQLLKNSNKYHLTETILLIISITIHNIPEGLAVGAVFASKNISNAIKVTLAIAIQNIPEGLAISAPINKGNTSKKKSFILGSLTGIVEPISAIIGYLLVKKIITILPFILSLAAGIMIYVIIQELNNKEKKDTSALLNIIGLSIMMYLELIMN